MDYTHDRRRRFYSSLLFWSGDMADAAIAVENQSHRRTAREITATAVVFTEENQFVSHSRVYLAQGGGQRQMGPRPHYAVPSSCP